MLPLHQYGCGRWTILGDEDIRQIIQSKILERTKKGFLNASEVVEIVTGPKVQTEFMCAGICKPTIMERTARNWLKKLEWRYEQPQKGMYIDGHERGDVVAYRKEFIARWKEHYEKWFHQWDDNGDLCPLPQGFPVPGGRFHLILITHDESTFYQNDEWTVTWSHADKTPTPKAKGDGQSIMVSDFLTLEWGRLCDNNECVHISFSHHI